MKLLKLSIVFLITSLVNQAYSHDHQAATLEVKQASHCSCGPIEHWMYKAAVIVYTEKFANEDLAANYDAEGLPENIVQAVMMLAQTLEFVDEQEQLIIPALNKKGNWHLPMSKDARYMLCKRIIKTVDMQTTLSAQELYDLWMDQLENIQ
ncbi:MAG: hypothetical protein ACXWL2_01750 [Candidatus Chromulinivorax sp.]